MTGLRTFIRVLLTEGRLDDVKAKYPSRTNTIESLASADPSGNLKYLSWMATRVIDDLEREADVVSLIQKFHQLLPRIKYKDINSYKSLEDVRWAVDEVSGPSETQRRQVAKNDGETIYNDGRFVIVVPHSKEAACHYGMGTKWCISATQSKNYYASYTVRGIGFYFVIDRNSKPPDPLYKVAFAFGLGLPKERQWNSVEIFDAEDVMNSLDTIASHYGPAWPKIRAAIETHLTTFTKTKQQENIEKMPEFDRIKAAYEEYMSESVDDDSSIEGNSYKPGEIIKTTQDPQVIAFMHEQLNDQSIPWLELIEEFMKNPNVPTSFFEMLAATHRRDLGAVDFVAEIVVQILNASNDHDRWKAILRWDRALSGDRNEVFPVSIRPVARRAGQNAAAKAVSKMTNPSMLSSLVVSVRDLVGSTSPLWHALVDNPYTPEEDREELITISHVE